MSGELRVKNYSNNKLLSMVENMIYKYLYNLYNSIAYKKSNGIKTTVIVILITLNSTLSTLANDSLVNNDYKSRAIIEMQKLEKSNRYVEMLTPGDLNELPIGLKRNINNVTYRIAISNAIFYSDYAELTAFAKVDIPQGTSNGSKQLFFGVSGLKFSYSGGIIGDAKLVLLGNINIPIGNSTLTLKGGFDMKTGQAQDLTYISMDCNGFREMGLTADISFPRSMLVPLDANGNRLEGINDKVHSSFQTVVSDWNDILVNISLPKFEITPLKGIGFNIENAIFDMSDLRNSPEIIYPYGYETKYLDAANPNLWQGIYVKNFSVILPKQFSNRNNPNQRISFSANNMLIDDNGISGAFAAENILSIEQGSASGWRFSVNEFHINLEANTLTGAGFSGAIGLPIANKEQTLGYTASISANNEYLLKINTLDTLNFNLWQATAQLNPNSYIQLAVVNDKFKPEANLNGQLGIIATNKSTTDTSKSIANFKGVSFRNLKLKTDAPYLSADYFGYNGTLGVAGFPVSVDSIVLSSNNTQATLSFGLNVNLMSGRFGGKTRMDIVGEFKNDNGIHSWAFQKVKLNTIQIKADFGAGFKMNGGIQLLEDDPQYGNAFGGFVQATFLDKVEVQAKALFGNKTGSANYRYWFVDARASIPGGIPVLPPLNINGLGGGAYYHVRKTGNDMLSSGGFPAYIPDENTGLGIRAAVMFNAAKDEVVNGEASLEASFNTNGGINYIGFFGYAKFLGKLPFAGDVNHLTESFNKINSNLNELSKNYPGVVDQLEKWKQSDPTQAASKILPMPTTEQSGFTAAVGIQYDFTQKTFHANFDLYVNAAGGLLKGVGSNNRAGWAVLHIAPGEWYLHMGTPTDRIGLQFGIGSFNIKTGSYLMVGDKIPGSPAPPQEVADILGVELQQLDYMRDLNALGDGRGFAFGSSLSVSTGDITFLILYANFKAGVGFDIMLKDYGDAHCAGSSSPVGINGWYANGQAYAYLQGELGVKVNLWLIKARIPIIKGGAAALLQAKLPNPSWFRGYLGVKFSLLGGLVKGNMRLKLTIGNECQIVTDNASPIDVKVIADLTPKDKTTNTDVFTAPQASFNMRLNQPFDVQDDNGSKTYRIKLEKLTVTDNNTEIPGRLEWNNNEDAVTFYSTEILPPNKPLKAMVKVSFEEQKGSNWQTVYVDGKRSEEIKEVSFTTGNAPTTIPLNNIEYGYPIVEQKNMYKDEIAQGYIKLKRGQSYLFDNTSGQALRFVSNQNITTTQSFNYDKQNLQLNFNLPTLNNKSTYLIDFYDSNKKTTENESDNYNQTDVGEDGSYAVKDNQANEIERGDLTKSILNYTFSTSQYSRFVDKMSNIRVSNALVGRVSSDVINLQTEVNDYEIFDIHEINGSSYTANKPLIQPVAVLEDRYFTEDIFPRNYKTYPLSGSIVFTNRDTALLGLHPVKALPLMNVYLSEVQTGIENGYAKNRLPYIYNLPEIYKHDFLDLQNQVVNKYLGNNQAYQFDYLINGYYPFIRQGRYKVIYQYVLPGGKLGSSKVMEYENPIK